MVTIFSLLVTAALITAIVFVLRRVEAPSQDDSAGPEAPPATVRMTGAADAAGAESGDAGDAAASGEAPGVDASAENAPAGSADAAGTADSPAEDAAPRSAEGAGVVLTGPFELDDVDVGIHHLATAHRTTAPDDLIEATAAWSGEAITALVVPGVPPPEQTDVARALLSVVLADGGDVEAIPFDEDAAEYLRYIVGELKRRVGVVDLVYRVETATADVQYAVRDESDRWWYLWTYVTDGRLSDFEFAPIGDDE